MNKHEKKNVFIKYKYGENTYYQNYTQVLWAACKNDQTRLANRSFCYFFPQQALPIYFI